MSWRAVHRGFASLAGALALACFGFGQAADIAKDARLQKPLSVKLKLVPLSVAIPELSKLTGVTLDSAPIVRDLKIDVFVKDVPAGKVLEKIASVLGCEWKADGDTFRITMTSEEQNARDKYIDAENKAAIKEITDELTSLTKLATIDPETIDSELTDQENARLNHKSTYDPARVELLKRAKNRQDVQLGKFLGNLSADKVTAFWHGDAVPASMADLGEETRQHRRPGTGGPPPIPRNGAISNLARANDYPVFVQFDPYIYQVKVAQGFGVRTVGKRDPKIVANPIPTGDLAKMPFGKEVLAWDQPVPADGDLAQITIQSGSKDSNYSGKLFSVTDFLEKAFDQTGVPFVADAFRVPAASKDINRGVGAFNAWLGKLKSDNGLETRFDDGIVSVRHGGFWRLRKFETPEEQFRVLEAKTGKLSQSSSIGSGSVDDLKPGGSKSGPTLDDYASFVAKLTPEQAEPFKIKDSVVALFDTKPLEIGTPALLFYNSLDRSSLAKAFQDGISYGQLSGPQRQDFINAAVEGIFLGATPQSMNLVMARLANTGEARGLGFVIRKDNAVGTTNAVAGQDLLFGASLTEASIYKLPVAQ